jgi:hypothetical protein
MERHRVIVVAGGKHLLLETRLRMTTPEAGVQTNPGADMQANTQGRDKQAAD